MTHATLARRPRLNSAEINVTDRHALFRLSRVHSNNGITNADGDRLDISIKDVFIELAVNKFIIFEELLARAEELTTRLYQNYCGGHAPPDNSRVDNNNNGR